MNVQNTWKKFQQHFHPFSVGGVSFALDLSRALLPENFPGELAPMLKAAHVAMQALERGSIANPDEGRMVGHYWLRAPELAPKIKADKHGDALIGEAIEKTLADIKAFAASVHTGKICGAKGVPFKNILCIGIGGSALGPQFAAAALGQPGSDKATPYFFDNTDPDGFDTVLEQIKGGTLRGKDGALLKDAPLRDALAQTLVIVASKSGGTIETANGMKEAAAAYAAAGLDFGKHAVAVTGAESKLDDAAKRLGFLARFPMWDWVGGRTSELSAVGLLPAALQGLDIDGLLDGAKAMDALTRNADPAQNPAALLAAAWYALTDGRGAKDMVVLPYKDRLLLLTRYLQQLVMESLGKERGLDGRRVNQGIAVYGNKGATDQHAYVQQLRDGVSNAFVTFIEVLKDRDGPSPSIKGDTAVNADSTAPDTITSGDYLQGFFLGTRFALSDGNRPSITLTIDALTPRSLGALIALFERTVGLYATLINVNAYDQPGVEAGKLAATGIIETKRLVRQFLHDNKGSAFNAAEIAGKITGALAKFLADARAKRAGKDGQSVPADSDEKILAAAEELVFKVCEHLAANSDGNILRQPGATFDLTTYAHV